MLKFNSDLAEFSLKNNLYVEYFIWVYLKSLNNNGFHSTNDLKKTFFKTSTFCNIKDNVFFKVSGNKIILTSLRKLHINPRSKNFYIEMSELNKFARKLAFKSNKLIKGWTKTLIKYFFICLVSCKYEDKKPYALSLIEKDTGCSVSTIQRALKNLFVNRYSKTQIESSERSYYCDGKLINISPNYNEFLLGKDNKKSSQAV